MNTIKTPATFGNVKTWGMMDVNEKSLFLAKLAIMLCSFGYLFGGVLVEGVVYETYTAQ